MFKRSLEWMIPLLVLSQVNRAMAFDPVTATMAAQTANSVMGQIDEAADLGFALTDLLSEVGIDSHAEEESLERAIDRLSQINSQARDLQWAHDDISRSINEDFSNGKSLSKRIRALRNTIRTSKEIATMMGFRPKAAEKAVKIQEIKLNSMMLEELQSIRRAQYLAYLESQEAKIKREVFLQEILQSSNSGVRSRSRNLRATGLRGGS